MLFSIITIYIVVNDCVYRKIKNKFVLILFITEFNRSGYIYASSLMMLPIIIFLGLILMKLNIIGGADIKILMSMIPWLKPDVISQLIVSTLTIGGVSTVIIYLMERYIIKRDKSIYRTTPFSIPILVSYILVN
ncbi:prepilin peptidase [Dongshaea marina]|uniref:prepilin peptidase n=1 Tax=Dongshaea marina TaxID=2047966 RepID=UPI000D3E249D